MSIETSDLWKTLSSRRRFILIAGPCVIESEKLCRQVAAALEKTCDSLGVTCVFKASYDKANRTSGKSFRGPGLEKGLKILAKIREEFALPVLTDVHTETQAAIAGETVEMNKRDAPLTTRSQYAHHGIQGDHCNGHVRWMRRDTCLGCSEDSQVSVIALACGTTAARLAFVAWLRDILEVDAARAL